MSQHHLDNVILTGSVAAVFSASWLPTVHQFSITAAEWLPILGGVSLGAGIVLRVVQIVRELKRMRL